MRCSGWKEDAGGEGRRLSKDDCWIREGTNGGVWNCALDLDLGWRAGRGTGDGGLMTSEVNRKRKSSGYVATGWDRSTRFVSSGLLVSFELTIQCTVLVGAVDHWTWTIWTADSGPLL